MDDGAFRDFLSYQEQGLKAETKLAVKRFVNSFSSTEEKEGWVRQYLIELQDTWFLDRSAKSIRHEIYEHLVFPVLYEGFKQDDPWSLMWLAKTSQNLHSDKSLRAKIDDQYSDELLERAYGIEPNLPGLRAVLLRSLVDGFDQAKHEWPSGLLIGQGREGLQEERRLIELARELDESSEFDSELSDYECKLDAYENRLRK